MGKAWQQNNIKITYHCKNQVENRENTKRRLRMEHHMIECVFTNTTKLSVCSQTQHPLHKNPLFKINLHTSEDQNHIV